MIKKANKFFIICLCISIFLFTGCWDYKDIEKKSIVISLGVDRVEGNIEFSTEVARLTPQLGESKEKAEITNVYNDLSYGKTFEEARIDYDSRRPYPTFLGATRVVVFGNKYAHEGIEPYLNRINKIYDYRKTLLAVVSRESPRELFNIKVENDISVGFLIEDNINFLSNQGTALYPTIGEILSSISLGEVGYVLPYIGIEQDSVKYLGLAVMKNSKLIGVIDTYNTNGILWILAKNPRLTKVIPSPHNDKNQLSFLLTVDKRKFKVNYVDEKVIIHIELDVKGELQYQYHVAPIPREDIQKLEKILSEIVKKEITTTIEKTQKEFQCDIFQFAKYFRAAHPEIYQQIKWRDAYPQANIRVAVNTKIVNENLLDANAKKKYE